jgi:hypothetical protein
MTRLRFAPAGLVALLILLAACSSDGSSTSPSASASAAASSAAASESADASESAEASESEAALPSIDLPNSDAELEALLPNEIGGQTLTKFSMRGAEFMAQGDEEFTDFLDRIGAEADDVSVAFGVSMSGTSQTGVFAFQVRGTDNDELLDELAGSLEEDGTAEGFEDANVGGKDVRTAAAGDGETGTVYLYGVGDIVFFITTADDDAAAEVLSDLP